MYQSIVQQFTKEGNLDAGSLILIISSQILRFLEHSINCNLLKLNDHCGSQFSFFIGPTKRSFTMFTPSHDKLYVIGEKLAEASAPLVADGREAHHAAHLVVKD